MAKVNILDSFRRKSLFPYIVNSKPVYRLEYYNEFGNLKTKTLHAKTKEEATIIAFNFLLNLGMSTLKQEHSKELQLIENKYKGINKYLIGTEKVNTYKSLLNVFDEFIYTKNHLSKRSIDDYKRLQNLLYSHSFRWDQCETNKLLNFQNSLLQSPAHHYIANHMVLFCTFIKYCVNCRYISESVYLQVKANSFKHPKMKKTSAIPKEIIEKILDYSKRDHNFSLLLELLLDTGARPTEIIKLNKHCLIPHSNKIKIEQFKTKKTLQITLSDELYQKCKAHFLLSPTNFAFTHGHKAKYYNKKWNNICKHLGLTYIKKRLCRNLYDLRQLRHTSLTESFKQTSDKMQVANKAGRSNTKITNKYIDPHL